MPILLLASTLACEDELRTRTQIDANEQSGASRWALDPKLITLGILVIGYVLVVGGNYPGHLSYDSVLQLLDGRTGRYHTWHPPLMAWLLGLGDKLLPGAALYVAFLAAILFSALGALVFGAGRLGRSAPFIAAVFCLLPLTLVWQGIVWKDVLFADFALSGFVCLFTAFRGRALTGWRTGLLVLGFVLLGAAGLVRQNGVVVVFAGAIALAHGLWLQRPQHSHRSVSFIVGAPLLALVGTLAVMAVVSQVFLLSAADPDGPEAQIHMLQTYDVVGTVAHDPQMDLDDLSPPIQALVRSAAKNSYTPATNAALLGNTFNTKTSFAADEIQDQWREIIVHHPLPWVEHRLQVFWWMVMTPNFDRCPAELTGVDGPQPQLRMLGLKAHQNTRDLALETYASIFHKTPLYSHLAYAVAALGMIVMMFRSRRRADLMLGYLLIGALLFVASFAIIGVACDYRYLYALDLSVMTVAFYVALDWRRFKMGLSFTGRRGSRHLARVDTTGAG